MIDLRNRGLWSLLALLALVVGCGESVDTSSVSGTVSVAGKPVLGGALNFFPTEGGRPVTGTLDEQGNYSLSLPPGDYKVVAIASALLPDGWTEGDPVTPPPVPIPRKYSLPTSSPLTITVVSGESLEKNFEL